MGNYLRKEGAPIDFLYLVDIAKVGIYFYFAKLFSCYAKQTGRAVTAYPVQTNNPKIIMNKQSIPHWLLYYIHAQDVELHGPAV